MPAARHSASLHLVLVLVAAAAACLLVAGCGFGGRSDDAGQEQRRVLVQARQQFTQAAAALLARDRDAFLAVAPGGSADADQAREELGEVFDALSPLPWRSFDLDVSPLDAAGGYAVRGVGQLGDAGPADRIAVVRYLELALEGDRVSVVRDETPEELRDRYLMALRDALVLRRPGLIVLGDRRARARAERVLAAAARARPRLRQLGIDTGPTVVVTVYGSAVSVRSALGVDASTSRLVFFAHPALRAADEEWLVYDVGVMGPWLRDVRGGLDAVLRHELAHAYTMRWFAGDGSAPALLVEGIAQVAEGAPAGDLLREEVATGGQLWPLPESLGEEDVWAGGDAEAVRLGYELGGALVGYVISRWGAAELRPFVEAVAAAEPTEAGMDEALSGCLGVGWSDFFDGWRRYVMTGD